MEELPGLFAYRDDETKPLVYAAPPQSEGYQMVKNYVELLCLSLRRRGGASALQPAKHAYSERFANSVAYLRAHVCDGVSLQDLCRHVGESPGTVKHLFRTFTGGGAMQYYRYLRCQHCIALLEQGQSMGDIAAAMNFSSQNYLSTFFKREMGVSPSEYLRQNASGLGADKQPPLSPGGSGKRGRITAAFSSPYSRRRGTHKAFPSRQAPAQSANSAVDR